MRAKGSVGHLLQVFMILLIGIVLGPASINGQVAQRGPDLPANKSSTRSGTNVRLQFWKALPTTSRVEPEHFETFIDDQPAILSSGILGPAGGETRAGPPSQRHNIICKSGHCAASHGCASKKSTFRGIESVRLRI